MNPLYASYFLGMVWLRWYAETIGGSPVVHRDIPCGTNEPST